MASATTVTPSVGLPAGPSAYTALWTALGPSAPFLMGGIVKMAYDLTLRWLFRWINPPEEGSDGYNKPWKRWVPGCWAAWLSCRLRGTE